MTKTATLTPDKPTDLRAVFGFHAVPFTREITTDDHFRLPFLDETLASCCQPSRRAGPPRSSLRPEPATPRAPPPA